MFHANAWGLPYGAALAGADLILPDRFLQAEPLAELIAAERPTLMGCVPTIFADLLRYADEHPERRSLLALQRRAAAARRCRAQLMKDFEERHRVRIFQAWGMTETSPVATYSRPLERRARRRLLGRSRQAGAPAAVGRAAPDRRRRRRGGLGRRSTGEIEVRGPWVAARYFEDDSDEQKFDSGWLRTGDIASVDERGFVQITDRSKDVIKSGGEWISSVELENELMSHPDVIEAAVIAKPDERWAERPLCCVVAARGRRDERAGTARAPARSRGQVVAAGRVRVRGRGAQDECGQVRQEGAARPAAGGHARGAGAGLVTLPSGARRADPPRLAGDRDRYW